MKRFKTIFLSSLLLIGSLAICGCEKKNSRNSTYNSNELAKHEDAKYNIKKKGIGVSRYNTPNEVSGEKIDNLEVGWYYNWGLIGNSYIKNAEYIPMVWGREQMKDDILANLKLRYENNEITHLLTFNEPDNNSQSYMTVDEAISYWPKLEALGIPLSSPCPCDYTTGWLDEFMEKAKELNYRVDFIAIHSYQDFSIDGVENRLKVDVLDKIYEKYKLPIWLTEYGAIDVSTWAGGGKYNPNCTEKRAKQYIENCSKMLESLGYVERYAWFLDNFNEKGDSRPKEAPYTSLYNDDDTLSSTGAIYKSINSVVPLSIKTSSLESGIRNIYYQFNIKAQGGNGNYSFYSNNLPKGLSLANDGTLFGTPNYPDLYRLKIEVKDETKQTTYKYLTLKIS